MTHKELVLTAMEWLENEHKCPLVFPELKCSSREIPDVIGFFDDGITVVIECKISKTDFSGDKKKPYRQYPEDGMGDYRYFAISRNIAYLFADEIPENWGLVLFDNGTVKVEIEPKRFDYSNKRNESSLLVAAIRSMGITTAFHHRTHPFIQIGPQLFNDVRVRRKYRSEIEEAKKRDSLYEEWMENKLAEEARERAERRRKEAEYLEWKENFTDTYNEVFPSTTGEPIIPIVMV
jgi:hypothetical protein